MPIRSKRSKTARSRKSAAINKTRNRKAKKIIASIFVSLLSIAFIGSFLFLNKLNRQLVGAESASSTQENYYTLVFAIIDDFSARSPVIKKLEYKVFDLENKKITSYIAQPDYQIDFTSKFGREEIAKLYALGKLSEENDGLDPIKFVNNAMFEEFAFPVDRYIYVDQKTGGNWEEFLDDGQLLSVLPWILKQNTIYTNMDLSQIYQTGQFVSSLPEDRRTTQDLNHKFDSIDDGFRELTLGTNFANEATSVGVLNASHQEGVAAFGARVVSNLGGRVVSIDNSEAKYGESFIIAEHPDSYSARLLAAIFGASRVISKLDAKVYINDNELYRADILLVLAK